MDQEQRERLIDQQERAEGKAGLLYGRHIRGAGIIGAEGKTIFHGQVCVAGVRALACRVLFISHILQGRPTKERSNVRTNLRSLKDPQPTLHLSWYQSHFEQPNGCSIQRND